MKTIPQPSLAPARPAYELGEFGGDELLFSLRPAGSRERASGIWHSAFSRRSRRKAGETPVLLIEMGEGTRDTRDVPDGAPVLFKVTDKNGHA